MVARVPKTEMLAIKDGAKYMNVTDRTIFQLAAANQMPAFMVGGPRGFSVADIHA